MRHYWQFLLLTIAGVLLLNVQTALAYGNDYLEKGYHYQVYTAGTDKIHFKIPIWAYGKINDYVALPTSGFSYKVAGQQEVEVANWCAAAQMDNTEENGRGTVAMKLNKDRGDILVTSLYTGVKYSVRSGGMWSEWLTVFQKEEEDCKHVTKEKIDGFIRALKKK